jgi:DNA-directed RNA polymerase specialized sigma24 family protein
MNIHERLLNWSYYVTLWLDDPSPKQPSTCRSFEKNYNPELGNVMEEDYPDMPSVDWKDGELLESCMKEIPDHNRRALKAFYVSFPYQSDYNIANHLRISVKKFQRDLEDGRTRIQREINRKVSGNKTMRPLQDKAA